MADIQNTTRMMIELSENVRAAVVERIVLNGSENSIGAISPIVNTGWDGSIDCMTVKPSDAVGDSIMGVCITPVETGKVRRIKYVTGGIIVGLNTSAWSIGDALRATTVGTLTTETTSEEYSIIPQVIAVVERVHETLGEINVVVGSSVDSGTRRKKDVDVVSGDNTITFDKPMNAVPHVDVSVKDENGTSIGADVTAESKTGFTVNVYTGGTGSLKMYYRAEVES